MAVLLFPTDTFPALVFNDFIEKDPAITCTYIPYSVQLKESTEFNVLIMDEDIREVVFIDRVNTVPQWLLYHIDRERTVAKLNRFVFSKLTCIIKEPEYCLFLHPADIFIHVWREADGVHTYLLNRF